MNTTKSLLSGAVSFALVITGLAACNQNKTAKEETLATTSPAKYPYTIEHPDNWETGDPANTLVALSSLKTWEEGKLDESLSYFGDSVRVQFDGLDKTLPNDSVKAFLAAGRNAFTSVKERMTDWESVISKDKSEEWVTLWYTQVFETKDGIKDSAAIINDIQLKKGKIIRLSEYTRKLH